MRDSSLEGFIKHIAAIQEVAELKKYKLAIKEREVISVKDIVRYYKEKIQEEKNFPIAIVNILTKYTLEKIGKNQKGREQVIQFFHECLNKSFIWNNSSSTEAEHLTAYKIKIGYFDSPGEVFRYFQSQLEKIQNHPQLLLNILEITRTRLLDLAHSKLGSSSTSDAIIAIVAMKKILLAESSQAALQAAERYIKNSQSMSFFAIVEEILSNKLTSFSSTQKSGDCSFEDITKLRIIKTKIIGMETIAEINIYCTELLIPKVSPLMMKKIFSIVQDRVKLICESDPKLRNSLNKIGNIIEQTYQKLGSESETATKKEIFVKILQDNQMLDRFLQLTWIKPIEISAIDEKKSISSPVKGIKFETADEAIARITATMDNIKKDLVQSGLHNDKTIQRFISATESALPRPSRLMGFFSKKPNGNIKLSQTQGLTRS